MASVSEAAFFSAEAGHINQIGEDFAQYDEMMPDMISAGLVKGK